MFFLLYMKQYHLWQEPLAQPGPESAIDKDGVPPYSWICRGHNKQEALAAGKTLWAD